MVGGDKTARAATGGGESVIAESLADQVVRKIRFDLRRSLSSSFEAKPEGIRQS